MEPGKSDKKSWIIIILSISLVALAVSLLYQNSRINRLKNEITQLSSAYNQTYMLERSYPTGRFMSLSSTGMTKMMI